jgi:hypothetical protein
VNPGWQTQQRQPQAPTTIGGFNAPMQGGVATRPVASQGPAPPFGAPPGGIWRHERYCGCTSCLLCLMLVPVCCCPCDERRTYIAPDGTRFVMSGSKSMIAWICCGD